MKRLPFFILQPGNHPFLKRWALFNIYAGLPEVTSEPYLNLSRSLHSMGYASMPADSPLKNVCFLHPLFQFHVRKELGISSSDEDWFKEAYGKIITEWHEYLIASSGNGGRNLPFFVQLEFQNLIKVHFLNLRGQHSIASTLSILSYILETQHKTDELIFLTRKTLAQLHVAPKTAASEYLQMNIIFAMDTLGRALKSKHQLQEAKTVFQEILDVYPGSQMPEDTGELYRIQGDIFRDLEDYPLSKEYTEKAIRIFEKHQDHLSLSLAYMNLGRWHYDQAEYAQALDVYKTALLHIEAEEDSEQKGRILQQMAGVYYQMGAHEDSERHYQSAYRIAQKFHNNYHQAKTLQGLGILASQKKNWKKSLLYYGEALKIYLTLSSQYPFDIAQLYYNMGNDAYHLEDYGAAKDYYLEASGAYHDLEDAFKEAEIWQNLANVYYYLEEPAVSRAYDVRAFQLFCIQKRQQQLVEILHNAYQDALENEEGKNHTIQLVSLLLDYFPEETVKTINESAIHYQD